MTERPVDQVTRPTVRVSVAISTLDRPQSLARCLDSLLTGTAVPAEIIVVDQSLEETARPVVEAKVAPMPIRYVAEGSRGLAAGQNSAVRRTSEPVVAVLDDDCLADETWLEAIARLFDSNAAVGLVGGRVLPTGDETVGLYPVSSRTSTTPREFRGRALPWDVGSGNNFALKREWFDRIGGCDERLGPGSPGRGGVDMDLFYRLLRAGAIARYDPALVVYHERASRSERLARRVPYGHGMAAACAIWLRGGDLFALRVLAAWLMLRGRLLASALRHRRWTSAWEELLVVGGTARGFVHGLRVGGRSPLSRD